MGYKAKMTHLSYDFLTLKSGMMASRTGNVITYRDLMDEALSRTKEEITKRHPDWNQDKINQVAKALSVSAIKFEMIKVSSDKVITFDIVDALKFERFYRYLFYSIQGREWIVYCARNLNNFDTIDYHRLDSIKEFNLVVKLAQYNDAVKKSGISRDPSMIARYIFELAQDLMIIIMIPIL